MVPAGTLYEMFEGRGRIRRFQKSRLRRAEQIRDLIAHKRLKVVRSTINPQDALAREIGPELTGLIRAAEANAGIVVRAAPVPRLGLEDRRDADMSAYASVLTDTHTILRVLQEAGGGRSSNRRDRQAIFCRAGQGLDSAAGAADRPTALSRQPVADLPAHGRPAGGRRCLVRRRVHRCRRRRRCLRAHRA